jgi:hypothetical protein
MSHIVHDDWRGVGQSKLPVERKVNLWSPKQISMQSEMPVGSLWKPSSMHLSVCSTMVEFPNELESFLCTSNQHSFMIVENKVDDISQQAVSHLNIWIRIMTEVHLYIRHGQDCFRLVAIEILIAYVQKLAQSNQTWVNFEKQWFLRQICRNDSAIRMNHWQKHSQTRTSLFVSVSHKTIDCQSSLSELLIVEKNSYFIWRQSGKDDLQKWTKARLEKKDARDQT